MLEYFKTLQQCQENIHDYYHTASGEKTGYTMRAIRTLQRRCSWHHQGFPQRQFASRDHMPTFLGNNVLPTNFLKTHLTNVSNLRTAL